MGNRNQLFFFLFGVMEIFRRRQYGGNGTTNTWEMGTGVHSNFGGSDTASTGIQHGTWDMGYGQFAIKPHRFRSRGNKRLKLKMIDFNTIGRLFVGLII